MQKFIIRALFLLTFFYLLSKFRLDQLDSLEMIPQNQIWESNVVYFN